MAVGAGSILIPNPENTEETRYHPLTGTRLPVRSRRNTPAVTPRGPEEPLPEAEPGIRIIELESESDEEPVPDQPQPANHIPNNAEPNLPEDQALVPPPYAPPEVRINQAALDADPEYRRFVLVLQAALRTFIPEVSEEVIRNLDLNLIFRNIEDIRNRQLGFSTGITELARVIQGIQAETAQAATNSHLARQEALTTQTALTIIQNGINDTPHWVNDINRASNEVLRAVQDLKKEGEVTRELIQGLDGRIDLLEERMKTMVTNLMLPIFPEEPAHHSTQRNINSRDTGPRRQSPERARRSPERPRQSPERTRRSRSRSPRNERIPKGAKAKKPEPFEGKRKDTEAENFLMKWKYTSGTTKILSQTPERSPQHL
jgi:hypothetical protein